MAGLDLTRIDLPTGVALTVQSGGPREAEPIVLLHGFPESHRTWRDVAPDLARDFFVVAPDQRGFAGSDKPEGVEAYRTDRIVEDLLALADILVLKRFTLVGHDWGGAVAWLAALRHPGRIARLVAVNAPHPLIFQKSLIEDEAQRAASQYMNAFRNPAMEAGIAVSEVVITSFSTVMDSRIRLASSEVGPSCARSSRLKSAFTRATSALGLNGFVT